MKLKSTSHSNTEKTRNATRDTRALLDPNTLMRGEVELAEEEKSPRTEVAKLTGEMLVTKPELTPTSTLRVLTKNHHQELPR